VILNWLSLPQSTLCAGIILKFFRLGSGENTVCQGYSANSMSGKHIVHSQFGKFCFKGLMILPFTLTLYLGDS